MEDILRAQDELFYATFPDARRRPSQAEIEAKHAWMYAPPAPPARLALPRTGPLLARRALRAAAGHGRRLRGPDQVLRVPRSQRPQQLGLLWPAPRPVLVPCPPSAAPAHHGLSLPRRPPVRLQRDPRDARPSSAGYPIDAMQQQAYSPGADDQYASPQDPAFPGAPYAAAPAAFAPALALAPPAPSTSATSTPTAATPTPTATTTPAAPMKRKERKARPPPVPKRYDGYYPASPLRSEYVSVVSVALPLPLLSPSACTRPRSRRSGRIPIPITASPSEDADADVVVKQEDMDDDIGEDGPSPAKRPRHSTSFSSASASPHSHSRSPSVSISPTTSVPSSASSSLSSASYGSSSSGKGKAKDTKAGAGGPGAKNSKDAPKKPPLACLFCRGRKIACGPPSAKEGGKEGGPFQCQRRAIKCEYPTESRRGMRKKKVVPAEGAEGVQDGSANAAASTSGPSSSTASISSATLSSGSASASLSGAGGPDAPFLGSPSSMGDGPSFSSLDAPFSTLGDGSSGTFLIDTDPSIGGVAIAEAPMLSSFGDAPPMASLPAPAPSSSSFNFGPSLSLPTSLSPSSSVSPTSALVHSLSATSLSGALSVPMMPVESPPPTLSPVSIISTRTRDPRLASSVRDAGGGAQA
ncbi:hypothetical protein MSAN_00080300 [Mycena sanguinolenta]|uniref:Zn(2)-C6 fungal-type domain-containing protein n=1 Tax=Mycena sanguinolenta TaxID=230812 RepID=A0A8H6ZCR0_9AGAR|nr:hypothetical protein MSAN_00080300 [Mycena sanguinolenta]